MPLMKTTVEKIGKCNARAISGCGIQFCGQGQFQLRTVRVPPLRRPTDGRSWGGGEHTYIYIYIRLKKCQIGLYILLDSDTPPYEMRRCPRYEQDGLLVRKPCFLPRGSGRLALELSEVFGFTVDCNGLGKKSAASAGIKQQLHRVCLQYLKPT